MGFNSGFKGLKLFILIYYGIVMLEGHDAVPVVVNTHVVYEGSVSVAVIT